MEDPWINQVLIQNELAENIPAIFAEVKDLIWPDPLETDKNLTKKE